jgi:hypothetical protein
MKELEVKSMLADPNIPDSYKLGGRLDERFLAGVEYAEAAMEKAPELWIARDKNDDRWNWIGGIFLFLTEPRRRNGVFYGDLSKMIQLPKESFPEVTFENSPQKIKIIIK